MAPKALSIINARKRVECWNEPPPVKGKAVSNSSGSPQRFLSNGSDGVMYSLLNTSYSKTPSLHARLLIRPPLHPGAADFSRLGMKCTGFRTGYAPGPIGFIVRHYGRTFVDKHFPSDREWPPTVRSSTTLPRDIHLHDQPSHPYHAPVFIKSTRSELNAQST